MKSEIAAVQAIRHRLDMVTGNRSGRIVVIVLTWNSSEHVQACLASIGLSTIPVATLVVDNASSDRTQAVVENYSGTEVTLVDSGGNCGYAGGNNIGLRIALAADADFAVIVNPDAILDPQCIMELMEVIRSSATVGLVSPAICYASTNTIWYAGADVDNMTGSSPHLYEGTSYRNLPVDPFETGRANGCVLALRLKHVTEIGLLDERYFLYFEEVEWSLRMREHGLQNMVAPKARAWHDVGHGLGDKNPIYQYYMTRNRMLIVSQYGAGGVRAAIPRMLKESLQNLWGLVRERPSSFVSCGNAIASGYIDFYRGRFGARTVSEPNRAKPHVGRRR